MALFGLAGALIGDILSFGIGYFGKDWASGRFSNSPRWINANDYFQKNAWMAIFFTRFLVTALAIPVNLIAGASGYKFSRFMFYDVLGETVWIVLYGGIGYFFGSQWETISQIISDFGWLLVGILLLAGHALVGGSPI
jgi:membrane protein DedA with SNARE-associated domain